jgi:biotin-(acetyl-CoA carboxylase) ligase
MPFVTLAAGAALADGIEASTTLRTILKWPNDVCVPLQDGSWRKLAGILAEARTAPGRRSLRGPRHRRQPDTGGASTRGSESIDVD